MADYGYGILLRERDYPRLLHRLRPMLVSLCKQYYLPDGTFDDLMQEARLGVVLAADAFRGDPRGFPDFARLVCTRKLYTRVKDATRYKHSVVNNAQPLDVPTGEDQSPLHDQLPGNTPEPHDVIVARDECFELLGAVVTRLTDWEFECLTRHCLGGEPYVQIGEPKRVDNAIFRARRKLAA